jgi:predicted nuclease of restriction endonuclease-like (RecB) superfamily
MDYDGDTQLHGYIDVDNRERLAEILNVDTEQVTQESLVGTAVVVQKKREPYWDEFIGRMYYEEELEKLIDNALKKRFGALGITLIKN